MLADFQALGVTIEPGTFDQVQGQEEAFEVWAINWQAVTGFLTIETQWRVTGTPVGLCWLGIDYTAAAAALRGRSQRRFQRLLADLRIMEAAALPILNNVRSPDGNNVRSPDGNNVRSPDGNNVRSPDGNNVRSPDGNRGTA